MHHRRIIPVWSAWTTERHGSLKSPPASPTPPGESCTTTTLPERPSHEHRSTIRPPPPPVSSVSLYCISSIQDVAEVIYRRALETPPGSSDKSESSSSPSGSRPVRIAVLWDADDTLVTKRRTVPLECKEVLLKVFGEESPLVNGNLQPIGGSAGCGSTGDGSDVGESKTMPSSPPPLPANIEHFILSMGTVDDLFAEGRPAPSSTGQLQPQTLLGQGLLYPYRHVFDRTLTPSPASSVSRSPPHHHTASQQQQQETDLTDGAPGSPVPPRLVRLGSSKALATYLLIDPIKCSSPPPTPEDGVTAGVKSPSPPATAESEETDDQEFKVADPSCQGDDLWSPLRGITIADQLKLNLTGSSVACTSSKLQMVSYFALSGHWDKVVLVDNSLEQLGVLLPLPSDWWSPQKLETEQVAEFSRRLQILAESSLYTTAEREKRVPMPEPPKEFAAFDDDIILNSELATTTANLLVRSRLERAMAAELEDLAARLNNSNDDPVKLNEQPHLPHAAREGILPQEGTTEVILCHLWTEGYPIILPQELRARRGTYLEPFINSLAVLERDLFDAYADGVADFEHRQKDRKLKEMQEAHHKHEHQHEIHPKEYEHQNLASHVDTHLPDHLGSHISSPARMEWKEFYDVIRRYLAEANRVLTDAENTILNRLANDAVPEERKLIREGCRQTRERLSRQMSIRWGYCGHLRRALYELEFAVVARPDEPFPKELKQSLINEFAKFGSFVARLGAQFAVE